MHIGVQSLLGLILTISLLYIAYWGYNKYLKKGKDGFDNGNSVVVSYFKATWCSSCQRMGPEWDKFVQAVSDQSLPITCIVYDADKEEDKPAFSQYNVDKFPTVLISKGGNSPIPYEGARDADSLLVAVKKQL